METKTQNRAIKKSVYEYKCRSLRIPKKGYIRKTYCNNKLISHKIYKEHILIRIKKFSHRKKTFTNFISKIFNRKDPANLLTPHKKISMSFLIFYGENQVESIDEYRFII